MTIASRKLGTIPTLVSTYLTTTLNALANGAGVLGSNIDNSSSRKPFITLDVTLASLTPTAGGYVEVYLMPSLDGTNFAEGDATNLPRPEYLVATWSLRAGVGARHLVSRRLIPCFWHQKLLILNGSGVAFGATGNILAYGLADETYETP